MSMNPIFSQNDPYYGYKNQDVKNESKPKWQLNGDVGIKSRKIQPNSIMTGIGMNVDLNQHAVNDQGQGGDFDFGIGFITDGKGYNLNAHTNGTVGLYQDWSLSLNQNLDIMKSNKNKITTITDDVLLKKDLGKGLKIGGGAEMINYYRGKNVPGEPVFSPKLSLDKDFNVSKNGKEKINLHAEASLNQAQVGVQYKF